MNAPRPPRRRTGPRLTAGLALALLTAPAAARQLLPGATGAPIEAHRSSEQGGGGP